MLNIFVELNVTKPQAVITRSSSYSDIALMIEVNVTKPQAVITRSR